MRHENITYLGGWLDQEGLRWLFRDICQSAGCPTVDLPDGVRRRQTGRERFWFNFDMEKHHIGDTVLPPISVTRETV